MRERGRRDGKRERRRGREEEGERGEKERGEWNGGVTWKKEGDKETGEGRNGGKAEEGRSKNIVPFGLTAVLW